MNNIELVKLNDHVVETWNNHDTEKFLDLCDDSVIWRNSKGPEDFRGKEQVKVYFNGWKTAFPDLKLKIRNRITDADQIFVEYDFSGTHKGTLQNRPDMPAFPATNKKVNSSGCYCAKIKNGLITEVNNYPDRFGLLEQLGLLETLHHESH
jgi:steroid delta-isomerase-like uncharacterized protein